MNFLLFNALMSDALAQDGPFRPDRDGTFWLPAAASKSAQEVDFVWNYIFAIDVFFFIVLAGAMIFFLFYYRQKSEGERTPDIKGSHTLEIAWSVGPGFLLIAMFWFGFKAYMNSVVPPADAYEIKVTGQKWFWTYTYTYDDKGELKTFEHDQLVVPKDRPVKLLMSSKDVLHSFYVPAFRTKKDVLPNRYTVEWFEPNWENANLVVTTDDSGKQTATVEPIEDAELPIFCTEYCGDGHSRMIGQVQILDPVDFDMWRKLKASDGPTTDGSELYATKGCNGCHSVDGSRLVGPSFKGLWGREEQLEDGSAVQVDENYLRESIVAPGAKIVAGYPPAMPAYAGQLTDEQIDGLITWIKTLN